MTRYVQPAASGVESIPKDDISRLKSAELLRLHARIADELRARQITRSSNNPVGDLAEYLFCKAFGWTQASNSYLNNVKPTTFLEFAQRNAEGFGAAAAAA